MDDLISRAAAIDALTDTNLKRNVDSVRDGDMKRTRRAAQRVIAQLPAVDAAPVVHGRWIDIPDKPKWDQKMCSVCGDYFCCQNNYCPNCGAKMDSEVHRTTVRHEQMTTV